MQAAGGYGAAPPAATSANQLQETVINFFKSYADNEVGCTIEACFDAVRSHGISLEQIRCAAPHPPPPLLSLRGHACRCSLSGCLRLDAGVVSSI